MNGEPLNTDSILENLTRTLLYEGYALYPYHRSAVKNQKPIPFGVVFPQHYNEYNQHSHSNMQTECIVTGSDDLTINITVRFLHLKKIELFQYVTGQDTVEGEFVPVYNLSSNGTFYQAGWQTIERTLSTGNLPISDLMKEKKVIVIEFEKMNEVENLYGESDVIAAKQITSVSEIKGAVTIEAASVENIQNTFKITVSITNTTAVENAETVIRDEVLSQSFLSTHTILTTKNGQFISQQDPGEKWKDIVSQCKNINAWPILIDESNTTMLSSPIILYDYPQINPLSSGDLFDSTEIEEALLLHVAVLSDDEKKRIAQSDEKLKAMLNKVSSVTPEELINFHSGLKPVTEYESNNKISEL